MTFVCALQVKGIPFLAFDAGGVLEMFDPKEFSDNVVFEPTLAALKRKLSFVVSDCLGPAHSCFLSCRSIYPGGSERMLSLVKLSETLVT